MILIPESLRKRMVAVGYTSDVIEEYEKDLEAMSEQDRKDSLEGIELVVLHLETASTIFEN